MPGKKTKYYRNEDGIIGGQNEYQVRRRDATREDTLIGVKTEEQQIIWDSRNEGGIVTVETTAYRERRRNTNGEDGIQERRWYSRREDTHVRV